MSEAILLDTSVALAGCDQAKKIELKRRWRVAAADLQLVRTIASQFQISELLARCLVNRGLIEKEDIALALQPRLKNLSDPFLLPDMGRAVDRLFQALTNNEALVVYGDYDVDGVTASAIISETLTALGWKVSCFIPHRMDDGYGLTAVALESCIADHSPKVLLAVDCGSTAPALIADLQGRGVDVIVLDHHEVSNPAPEPLAFVNPKRFHDGPFHEFCSAGLAFKLCHAVLKRARAIGMPGCEFDPKTLLDLVALGTVADVVPLVRENRIFVRAGLEQLQQGNRAGIAALKEVAQCRPPFNTTHIGFQLAPRLNAAGRLESAKQALDLLLTKDAEKARSLAAELDAQNRRRQELERAVADSVVENLRRTFDPQRDYAIVAGADDWHIGVIGIVASRVLKEFYRPTIIMGGNAQEWRGSGRSIEGFDLAAGLNHCTDLLVRHGGHAMAAGLSIKPGNLERFRQRLNDLARESIAIEAFTPVIKLDAEVKLDALSLSAIDALAALEPFGQENPPLRLCVRSVKLLSPPRRMGKEQQHARWRIADDRGVGVDVVWWNCKDMETPSGSFDLAFEPQTNDYDGRRSVQLKALEWRPTVDF